MRRIWAFTAAAFALAFLAACGTGGGCDAGPQKPQGQSSAMPAGGGGGGGGGLGEPVSFQGLGRKQEPPPVGQPSGPQVASAASGPAAAPGASGALPSDANALQSVLCGGFPDLPPDCKTSPLFDAIKKKCCPSGTVERCQAVPGGARLIGRACTAPAR